jgi:hypothetical protein
MSIAEVKRSAADLITNGPLDTPLVGPLMLSRKHCLILLSFVLIVCGWAQAQRQNADSKLAKPAEPETRHTLRSESVTLVRTFAERASRFEDVPTKISTLSSIAGVLWKDDAAYATRLLMNSFDAVERCLVEHCDERRKIYLRNMLISRAARLDPTLTQQMVTSINDSGHSNGAATKGLSLLYAAAALLDSSPAKALALAEQSLRFGVTKEFRSFLFKLKTKNSQAADNLFLKALMSLRAQLFVDANVLMHLGGYLYKSPNIPVTESAVEMSVVAGQLVVSLAVERPNISERVVRAYLNTVVDLLSKPISDPEQAKFIYAIGNQLYPKVQQRVPDRAAQLTAIMNSRRPALEQRPDSGSLPDSEKSRERKMDSDYLTDAQALFQAGEFESAAASANKIADDAGRAQVLKLINFYEALQKIDGDLEGAQDLVRTLEPGKERTLLLITIVQRQLENQQSALAQETITATLKDIGEMPSRDQGALLFVAASQMSALDLTAAKEIFSQSLKKVDNTELESLIESTWSVTIMLDEIPHRFSLGNSRVERKPSNLIRQFLTGDRDWTVAAVLGIDKEKVLGPLLVSLAQAVLPPMPQKETNP